MRTKALLGVTAAALLAASAAWADTHTLQVGVACVPGPKDGDKIKYTTGGLIRNESSKFGSVICPLPTDWRFDQWGNTVTIQVVVSDFNSGKDANVRCSYVTYKEYGDEYFLSQTEGTEGVTDHDILFFSTPKEDKVEEFEAAGSFVICTLPPKTKAGSSAIKLFGATE